MKKKLVLTLSVALGLLACKNENDWGDPTYGRNKIGDSVKTENGHDYYYRGGGWMMIPRGYYGSGYINGASGVHGGYVNESFSNHVSAAGAAATSRGGFGSSAHSSFGS